MSIVFLQVSSEGMLSNVLWVLLRLCEPFLAMGDAKAEALANKTDLDYFHGSDRYRLLFKLIRHLLSCFRAQVSVFL